MFNISSFFKRKTVVITKRVLITEHVSTITGINYRNDGLCNLRLASGKILLGVFTDLRQGDEYTHVTSVTE